MPSMKNSKVIEHDGHKYRVTLEVASNNGPEVTGPIDEATITSTFAKHVADVYKKYLGPKEDIDVKISKAGETVVFDLKPGYNSYIDSHSKEDGDDAKKAYTGAMIQKAVNPYIRRAVGTAQNETGCKNAKYKYNVDSKKLKITITFSGCEVVNEESVIIQEGKIADSFKALLKKIASVLHFTKNKPEDKEVEKKGKIAVSKEDQKEPLKEFVIRKDKNGKSDGKVYVFNDKEYGNVLAYVVELCLNESFKNSKLPAKVSSSGNVVSIDASEAVKETIEASEAAAKKDPEYAKSFNKAKEEGYLENSSAKYIYDEFISPALHVGYKIADDKIIYVVPKEKYKTHTTANKMVVKYIEKGKFEAKFTGWLEKKK